MIGRAPFRRFAWYYGCFAAAYICASHAFHFGAGWWDIGFYLAMAAVAGWMAELRERP